MTEMFWMGTAVTSIAAVVVMVVILAKHRVDDLGSVSDHLVAQHRVDAA